MNGKEKKRFFKAIMKWRTENPQYQKCPIMGYYE